jgi:hypothetical protein
MKFFAFIMSIIVLALSCMPCMDEASAMKNEKAKIEISKPGTEQTTDHNDSCSPFCTCDCCAGFSINHSMTSFSILDLTSSNIYSSFLPSHLIRVSLPIWQPPRV